MSPRGWLATSCVLRILSLSLLMVAPGARADEPGATMSVEGKTLRDRFGEPVVLRGANAMIVYWDRPGTVTYPEVAETGANCCRIFWTVEADATPEELDATLANCRAQRMIPMPSLWDATGKWDQLETCVDYWCRPEIVAVLKKHEDVLLLNIANEAGDGAVTDDEFRAAYASAIRKLRDAGLRMPLVIDAANWGRGERYLLDHGPFLLDQDPDRNLIFSWHPWDAEQPEARYEEAFRASIERDLCLIVGEFSHLDVFYKQPIDYDAILRLAHEHEIGWLAWVWWCCEGDGDGHSITTDKTFGRWNNDPWGRRVVLDHPFGIKNTARRPRSILEAE